MTDATIPISTEPTVESPIADKTETTEAEAVGAEETFEEQTSVEEQMPTEEIANAPKASVSKRRTIFNPFGKSKKEDQEETEGAAVETAEQKKKTKGFGSFFSRSKSAPKVNEEGTNAMTESELVATELPQIKQLQPIETEDVTEAATAAAVTDGTPEEEVPEVKKAAREVSETAEGEAVEVAPETEQTDAQVNTPIANKRQSFISKIFGKKKQEEAPKEVVEELSVEPSLTEAPKVEVAPTVETEHGEAHEEEKKEETRPSSPLGRLTELFSKKKKSKTPTSPVTPADPTTEEEREESKKDEEKKEDDEEKTEDVAENVIQESHSNNSIVETTPAVVVASA
ncbi:hypothetical protein G6F64_005173 [Rhizopus arrhizus]|uniref:Uncharacterized protein n=1 Tax=Rhizopus oryzae TaxID=64495 RepID=A0A9P6XBB6_RHIOR|nr:hypothetical protein G6F24_006447 [Rhizopus arrhizus]KAG0949239.1 hypothetical protein G6F32_005555 [Rhizopus arrhizus]KAG1309626.1 hypothetical protein G6F64_005173 [Rhizopus arrhizus]